VGGPSSESSQQPNIAARVLSRRVNRRSMTLALAGAGLGVLTMARPGAATASRGSQSSTSRLALVRTHRLVVREAAGDEATVLEVPNETYLSYPAWSPNGTAIAHTQVRFDNLAPDADWGDDIYLAPISSDPARLVLGHDRKGALVQGLAWMPDGASLLFGYHATLIDNGRYAGRI
jgi:hypothetical protein